MRCSLEQAARSWAPQHRLLTGLQEHSAQAPPAACPCSAGVQAQTLAEGLSWQTPVLGCRAAPVLQRWPDCCLPLRPPPLLLLGMFRMHPQGC